jgi:hypothetical protein
MLRAGRLQARFRMSIYFSIVPNPFGRTMTLGSTEPPTEMSTRNLPAGRGRPARKADNLVDCLDSVGSWTSHNPIGLHGLLQ